MALTTEFNFIDRSYVTPDQWAWDFADGVGTSILENPSYIYPATSALYLVRLSASAPVCGAGPVGATVWKPVVVRELDEVQATQVITFANPGQQLDPTLTLSATATSALPVQFSVTSGPATLLVNVLTFTGIGMVTVQADQPGDDSYLPAPPVVQSFQAGSSGALFHTLAGVVADSGGNVYIADSQNFTLRKFITFSGFVSTPSGLAGNFGTADGTGSTARYIGLADLAVDGAGNIYGIDYYRVRTMATGGTSVTSIAGTSGTTGYVDDTGTLARFNYPNGLVFDSVSGCLYLGDVNLSGKLAVRKITLGGVVSTAGTLATVGSYSGTSLAVDSSGNVYIADLYNSVIRKMTPGGAFSIVAGSVGAPGHTDANGGSARFRYPRSICADGSNGFFIYDGGSFTIRHMDSSFNVSTVAGLDLSSGSVDGTGSAARFIGDVYLFRNATDNIFMTEQANVVRRMTASYVVNTVAGTYNTPGSADYP